MSKRIKIIGSVAGVLLLISGAAMFADVGADARAPRMGVKGDRLDMRPLGLKPGGQTDGVRRIGANREVFKIAQSHAHDRRQQF